MIVRNSSVNSGETDNTSSLSLLDKSTSIKLFRYLEKIIFNFRIISSYLKNASFENISEILPQIPAEFKRACYGEWIYENNLPKCLTVHKIYNFSWEEKMIGKEYCLQDFPPTQFMSEPYKMSEDEVVCIIPIRSGSYEMGVFSYIAPINQYTEFINVNFTALNYEFFSFVMDRELYAEEIKKKNNEKISAINTMVAGISHELNTPTGIGISASTFITEKADKLLEAFENGSLKRQDLVNMVNDIRRSSTIIFESMNRSSELIKTFKLLSFYEPEELKKFNVKQNAEYIINLLRSRLMHIKQNIQIICDDSLEVVSYPGILEHIITNLVINSIIHGFEKDSEGSIIIEYHILHNRLILLCKDNGKGMRKEVVNKIFDAFFTTKHAEGTGLGLNIVYNLVKEYLKGTIFCESEMGKGTKFTIEFPVKFEKA
jgi:signal transduction histidine kinase